MLEDYGIYIYLGLGFVAFCLSLPFWSNAFYVVGKHWRLAVFAAVMGGVGTLAVFKQQEFKYNLAFNYFVGTKNTDSQEARYQIRQCKEFVQAKLNGETVAETHTVSAGFINISSISTWDLCARTFGMNYWKHDTSIDGQDGGRLLCEAYARGTYRSGKVNAWCDTVFTPSSSPSSAGANRHDVGT